jgi:hypothetical protein
MSKSTITVLIYRYQLLDGTEYIGEKARRKETTGKTKT